MNQVPNHHPLRTHTSQLSHSPQPLFKNLKNCPLYCAKCCGMRSGTGFEEKNVNKVPLMMVESGAKGEKSRLWCWMVLGICSPKSSCASHCCGPSFTETHPVGYITTHHFWEEQLILGHNTALRWYELREWRADQNE